MYSRLLILLLISVAFTGFGHYSFASTGPTPLAVIPLESHPGGTAMMTLRANVRGHEGVFIFDTGGGISYVSPTFAQLIGCDVWGQITGFVLTGQRLDIPRCDGPVFDIQGKRFAAPMSGVFDIMKFMPRMCRKLTARSRWIFLLDEQ